MDRPEQLKEQIEVTRKELNKALEKKESIQDCYEINLRLDCLIEKYIELLADGRQAEC